MEGVWVEQACRNIAIASAVGLSHAVVEVCIVVTGAAVAQRCMVGARTADEQER